jgi:hypothetical protein
LKLPKFFHQSAVPLETSEGGSVIHRYAKESWAETKIGLPTASALKAQQLRERAYDEHFGSEGMVSHEIIPLIPHVDVMTHVRTATDGKQVTVLVTSGMSDLPMNVPKKHESPRRVELIFYCDAPEQKYIDILRFLAHFPHDQKTFVGPFHTIPNGNPPVPLWDTSELDTLFLLPPLVNKDRTLSEKLVIEGDAVELLWVVPITSAECNLKLAKGSSALLELFTKNRHPYVFDPNRKSYA